MTVLRIQFSNGQVEERRLADGRLRIGRESGDIVLRDPSSSAVHGELVIRGSEVIYTDLGSSNGSFDAQQRRLTGPTALLPGQSVRLGTSVLTLLGSLAPAVSPPAVSFPAAPLPAASPPAAAGITAPAPLGFGHSHPESSVRHSYPVAIQSGGFGDAVRLMLQTMPFIGVRLGILCGLTIAAIVYWVLLVGGYAFLSRATPLLGWAWIVALVVVAGSLWRFFVRYALYLLKAGHIAVLTELITTGKIANGNEGMFSYAKRMVTERFGEVNAMFALNLLIDGIVSAFNRTLDWIANLLPIPGLDSVMGVVRGVLRASTTYIDETIFSYNLARGDENVFRSSKDGLIYYAQNAKEVLKTGVWVVVLDYVLTFVVWIVMLAPAFALVYFLPQTGSFVALFAAALFAANVRSAILHPLFLTMVMVRFHVLVRNQAINPEWDQRLAGASTKFEELKQKAQTWVRPAGHRPAPAEQPA